MGREMELLYSLLTQVKREHTWSMGDVFGEKHVLIEFDLEIF